MQRLQPHNSGFLPSAAFRSGHGLSPYHIDCSVNPLDLRPAADMVLNAYAAKREEVGPDATIVIVMGESHYRPAHKSLQNLVVTRMHTQGENLAVSFEQPHNILAVAMKAFMELKVPDGLRYCIGDYDPDGQAVLPASMGYAVSGSGEEGLSLPDAAPHAHHNLAAYCYRCGISSWFNDAAQTRAVLDPDDPDTAAAMEEHIPGFQFGVDITQPIGMAIRNTVTATRVARQALKNDRKTVIQVAGRYHLFGSGGLHEEGEYPYAGSLCAAFRRSGVHVLPVFVTSQSDNYGVNAIPPEAYSDLKDAVIVDGVAENRFYSRLYSAFSHKPFTQGAEEAFIAEICKASGEEIDFTDVVANAEGYRQEAKRRAEKILGQYRRDQSPWNRLMRAAGFSNFSL